MELEPLGLWGHWVSEAPAELQVLCTLGAVGAALGMRRGRGRPTWPPGRFTRCCSLWMLPHEP